MKDFKKIVASIVAVMTISSLSTVSSFADIFVDYGDGDMVSKEFGISYGETMDVQLNNGETFPVYSWDYIIRDSDTNEVKGYVSGYFDRQYTIYNGVLYQGEPVFEYNGMRRYKDTLRVMHEWANSEYPLSEIYPEYNLPENGTELYRDLDGNFLGYKVRHDVLDSDGNRISQLTLPTGEILDVPKYDENGGIVGSVSYIYNNKGEFTEYIINTMYDIPASIISIGESTTVGDSTTVGESEPTGVRGDINYDGKVTTLDLLLLKRYLLGIIKW